MDRDRRESDPLLKLLIQKASDKAFRQMHVDGVKEWLNADLPRIRSRRADLLGRTADGRLLHIEVQGHNDGLISIRMPEYGLAILRVFDEYPCQLVIYVGKEKMAMPAELRVKGLVCEYRVVDIRDPDAAALLASRSITDNILAVLVGLNDAPGGIRRILHRIKRLKSSQRQEAYEQLLVTCGLRGVQKVAEKERRMLRVAVTKDLSYDLAKYKFIADAIREGREKGREKGHEKGLLEDHREIVRTQLEKRFGPLPASVTRHLAKLSQAQTKKLALAVLDAKSLKDLFPFVRR